MKYIDIMAVKKAVKDGVLTVKVNDSGDILLADVKSGEAAKIGELPVGRWIEEKKQTIIPVEFDAAGEPILHDYVVYHCDQCGRTERKKEPYCHCGARMVGK